MTIRFFGATCLLLYSCQTVPTPAELARRKEEAAAPKQAVLAVENPRLYARDGSVVSSNPRGSVEPRAQIGHDLEPPGGGRMYILELYQGVMDERDQLQREVGVLQAESKRQAQTLTDAELRYAALEERVAELEEGKRQLVEENLDLAGRLTTAQIRRLEAERLLLESRIREARREITGIPAIAEEPAPPTQAAANFAPREEP